MSDNHADSRCRPLAARQGVLFGLSLLALMAGPRMAAAVTVFSSGMVTPETISPAPAAFGSFGGSYFVPDFNGLSSDTANQKIWIVPQAGGGPTVFTTNLNSVLLGGLFLPTTGWGALSGDYLTTGRDVKFSGPTSPYINGETYTYSASGTASPFFSLAGATFTQPQIAPAGFGTYGGDLIVGDNQNFASGV